ncbi:MsnO8 family LLM class oxidoreductase [Paenibacillus sp. Marseille-Q4541]|uniref:MsnO8 family LLM class oxidoreductase n=1 Tax=Paenibacillus sp. Marseille-Q4541 TaxID=2831522 RepID=UPI001BAB0AC6|nr:MsnO8 family LLM class oxidoreductase [Paenibacillus sp. Marseille-Q4541]
MNQGGSKHIELGILDLVPSLMGVSAEEALRQSVQLAIQGEKWGYQRYWTSEHHNLPGTESASPEVLLSHIGAKTERIKLGSGAVLLPYHHPIRVAEHYHMLAALYPGRIELGIGRAPGGSAHLSMALAGNYLEKVVQYPELIKQLQDLLHSRYSFDGEPILAKPVPETPPSLWLLGTNVKSAEYAAKFGTGYVFGQFMSEQNGLDILQKYREQFVPSENLAEPKASIAVNVICASSADEAHSWKEEALILHRKLTGGITEVPSYSSIIGHPKEVKQELLELVNTTGCNQILISTRVASYEQRLLSYRLLAEEFNKA